MQLVVEPNGVARCLYDEAIDLGCLGQIKVTRGSYVEPTADGQWWADMAPMCGPVLGPFALRSEALVAERQWLEEHWLVAAQ